MADPFGGTLTGVVAKIPNLDDAAATWTSAEQAEVQRHIDNVSGEVQAAVGPPTGWTAAWLTAGRNVVELGAAAYTVAARYQAGGNPVDDTGYAGLLYDWFRRAFDRLAATVAGADPTDPGGGPPTAEPAVAGVPYAVFPEPTFTVDMRF